MSYNRELDCRGLACPLPILRTKKALAEMHSGNVLKVIATDVGSVKDFPAFAQQTGHTLQSSTQEGDEFIFLIQRR